MEKDLLKKVEVKPNQNLLGLIVVLVALGVAEYYHLVILLYFGFAVSSIFLLSNIFTLKAYTRNYCKKKEEK